MSFAWTTFAQNGTTDNTIYVSSSSGNDANPGTIGSPVQSLSHGYSLLTNGNADWLLLKKGDTFTVGGDGFEVKKGGRSTAQRMQIGAYGTGARPIVKVGNNSGISCTGGGGTPSFITHLAFVGIHFYASVRDPNSPDYASPTNGGTGCIWLRGTDDLTFEDCVFQGFQLGGSFNDSIDNLGMSGIRLRRCLYLDSYSTDNDIHSQALFFDTTVAPLIEECVIDIAGWHPDALVGGARTQFNHGCYIQYSNTDPVFINNIVLRGSANGVQMRPGGTCEGNVFGQCAIGILVSQDTHIVGLHAMSCRTNVVTEGVDIDGANIRAWGIDVNSNVSTAVVDDNIVCHALGSAPFNAIVDDPGASYSGNIISDWGHSFGGSLPESPGPFVDSSVTLGGFAALHGGSNSFASFAALCRANSKDGGWNIQAQDVVAYFQAGFAAPAGHTFTAARGAFALTGEAVGMKTQRRFVAARGATALTGQALGLHTARRFTAARGAFAFTGEPVNLSQSSPGTFAAAAGQFNLNGYPVLFGEHDAVVPTKAFPRDRALYECTARDARLYTCTADDRRGD